MNNAFEGTKQTKNKKEDNDDERDARMKVIMEEAAMYQNNKVSIIDKADERKKRNEHLKNQVKAFAIQERMEIDSDMSASQMSSSSSMYAKKATFITGAKSKN
jgi:hypothetical protein